MTHKIVTVVGARPQFIKAATVSRLIRKGVGVTAGLREVIVHTGQHYDESMSQVFFDQLHIPRPAYNLGLGGGRHGEMTGRMLVGIEQILLIESPALVLVYGDTNSTLAGALAAVKLSIPVAHVEAGLRSFSMRMPEEVNRILTDRISSLLFCPTTTAVANLTAEGIRQGVYEVGDVMYDASLFYSDMARRESVILNTLGLTEGGYVLATCHRAENTDDPASLAAIMGALAVIAEQKTVVLPLHPRTRKILASRDQENLLQKILVIDPVSYIDMVRLEQSATAILTDSGGVQKEAFFYGVPCITLRNETEWVETVALGWNTLCGAERVRILEAWNGLQYKARQSGLTPYGRGDAAEKVVATLAQWQT
jgi:UDP-GlcNAc3NAcA epimerase